MVQMIGKALVGGFVVAGLVGGISAAEWTASEHHIEEARDTVAAANADVTTLSDRILESTGDPEMAQITTFTLAQLSACGTQIGMADPTDTSELTEDQLAELTNCVADLPADMTGGIAQGQVDSMLNCTDSADVGTALACIAAAFKEGA